jgi:hypothetical protein
VIGLARLTNPNFYNLVHCFVYFHNATQEKINSMYLLAEQSNRSEQEKQNQLFKNKKICFDQYEKINGFIDRKKRNIQRDKGMSVGNDRLPLIIKKLNKNQSTYFFMKKYIETSNVD